MNKYTILLAEDDRVNQKIFTKIIKNLYKDEVELLLAKNISEIFEHLNAKENEVDIIITDYELENKETGFQVLDGLKNSKFKNIPVIFITGSDDEKVLENAFKYGAVEFLKKPYKKTELNARLLNQFKIKELINELEKMANYDSLTGLYNRRKVMEIAEDLYIQEPDKTFTVIMDLDNFKSVNDTYGHDIGDQILKKFASILKETRIPSSVFGRIGGEEFAIIGNYSNKHTVLRYLEDIRKKWENTYTLIPNTGEKLFKTTSIGVAFSEDTPMILSLSGLLKAADIALYKAKNSGKNKIVVYQEGMEDGEI